MDYSDLLFPIFAVIIIIFLMLLMVYLYRKVGIWYLSLGILMFSIIIGINSLSFNSIPFTPYFQSFFILFQTIIFLIHSIEMYKFRQVKREEV